MKTLGIFVFIIVVFGLVDSYADIFRYKLFSKSLFVDSAESKFINDKVVKLDSRENIIKVSAAYYYTNRTEGKTSSYFSFKEDYNFKFDFTFLDFEWTCKIHSELSYLYFLDSIWMKNRDMLLLTILGVNGTNKNVEHSYGLMISTPLLNEYNRTLRNSDGLAIFRSGGFLNPAVFQMSYGLLWKIDKRNSLNIAFATIRIDATPRFEKDEKGLSKLNGSNLQFRYGFSTDLLFSVDFNSKLKLNHESHFFANGFDRNSLSLVICNRIDYAIYNGIVVRLDSRFTYEPIIYKCLQKYVEMELCIPFKLHKHKVR